MYAKDAKAQQAGLAPGHQSGRVYPSAFNNKEKLALSTPGSALKPNGPRQWLHSPLVPGTTETWTPASTEKSGVRSVYTADDPSKFDVVYHDNRAGASGKKGFGKFVKAEYHPAVEEKDRD
ncbi:uncharacterized protein GGS22DRAFT_151527 [Annulohypoxylon maeteangense]|uniref:uncharacterized protein n=1 Tax=Annulohypoxylon maeteangense TaxID=1927788 RepID=UPI0020074DD6|nr:uncharacterized protein GGS22DRAFT_151527 [Annulohypoxylon maeteangense]KAI0890661.1 hypothetical protein GGS22DRAFT_151527 [Annulohypoxylon maeteangense]